MLAFIPWLCVVYELAGESAFILIGKHLDISKILWPCVDTDFMVSCTLIVV